MADVKTETKTAPTQILRLEPSRLPIVGSIAKEFDVTPDQWRVLIDQIFPSAKTVEAIGMALAYCRARNLDIFKRPVHIVPMYSTVLKRMVETVWPGISEIRTTAMRTGDYAGMSETEFGPNAERRIKVEVTDGQSGEVTAAERVIVYPEWAKVTVYRWSHGQKVAFPAIVYWEEAYATKGKSDVPNEMWSKRPRGQLEKCVEAAALRKGFPEEIGNLYAAEEMEGRVIDAVVTEAATPALPTRSEPPDPPAQPEPELHNSDQQAGAKNEALTVAGDPDEEALAELEAALAEATTEDEVESLFDQSDIQLSVAGNDDALARAFEIKRLAVERVNRAVAIDGGQGDLLGGNG